ncbi:MAG: DNA/RNA non-specific endonuclease [Lachnoclostridium sp.]|nr:DNA/RNA non-specific endonuclease [Lachnospira sp.]MCM1247384.1 DNA/RNA non-specific endonuclease [Lachnoclostridium sp.]MCM1535523.1 DNA/RNA non-specific endonuclease [Clostridium sp.]
MKSIKLLMMAAVISIGLAWSAYSDTTLPESGSAGTSLFSVGEIAPYSGKPYIEVNNNIPYFSEADLTVEPFERYSDLDEQGRCGTAYANICTDLMPTEEHGEIGQIRPSGWHTVKYNDIIDGNYLYNRCHLIGYQLAGENANEKNLITGTRYLNVQGMLPYENRIADYVTETGNHVLYRVTPVFEGDNLLASGVLMEAESVEDKGEGILFCVYVYNVQPGIIIDYASGESGLDEVQTEPSASESFASKPSVSEPSIPEPQGTTYILNTNTKKFHCSSCPSVGQMKEKNKQVFTGNREDVLSQGYAPCKNCNP